MADIKADVFDFIASLWSEARIAAGLDPTTGAGTYLYRLRDHASDFTISDKLPTSRLSRAAGAFSPSRRALWLNRAALGTWLGENQTRKDADDILAFYSRNDFGRPIGAYLKKHATAWWDEVNRRWPALPLRSVAAQGFEGGIFWFGVRSVEEIKAQIAANPDVFAGLPFTDTSVADARVLLQMTAEQRAFLLQQRIADALSIVGETLPGNAIEVEEPAGHSRQEHKGFVEATHVNVVQDNDELLGALLLPSWTTATRDKFLDHVNSASACAAPELAAAIADEPPFGGRDYAKIPECHIRVYALARDIDAWLQERLVHKPLIANTEIFRSLPRWHVYDHGVWIEEFVKRATAAVMAAYDGRFFPIVAWHHELQQPLQELAVFMRVVGRKESGRSTALYHAASGHKGGVIVIGGRRRYQRTVLATDDDVRMIQSIIRSASGDWLIILDGAELENGQPMATTTLGKVLDLAYRENDASRSTRIRVFCAASSLQTDSSLFSYGRLGSRYMDLNVLDTNLVRVLLGTWIATYEIDITAERHDRLLGAFSAAEAGRTARGTPADIGQWTVGEIVQRLRTVSSKTVTDHDVERLIAR